MSIEPQIIHSCDHVIVKSELRHGYVNISRNKNIIFSDKIPPNIEVLRIDEVCSIDQSIIYSKGIDYDQLVSSESIEWISTGKQPLPGSEYKILCSYIHSSTQKFSNDECPRCENRGWYASYFGRSDSCYVDNMTKLVQDVIKNLFTEKTNGYGSVLPNLIGSNVYEPGTLSTNIVSAIKDCQNQIIKSQEENIINGIDMLPGEMLKEILVQKISFTRNSNTCYVMIKIVNQSSEEVSFSFKL